MNEKKLSKTALNILKHATQMFASYGYEGTIMDNLSKQAEVNKASLYYHFQDKANLYEQCLIHLFKPVVDHVIAEVDGTEDIEQKLITLITSFAQQVDKNPQMPAVLMREFAGGGMNMPIPARKQMQRILYKIKEILTSGSEKNIFHPIDPFSTHIMIVGSLCLFVTSQPMRKAMKNTDLDPKFNKAVNGIVEIILNGILK
jgi:AcrR family transcriptional regulator